MVAQAKKKVRYLGYIISLLLQYNVIIILINKKVAFIIHSNDNNNQAKDYSIFIQIIFDYTFRKFII